MCQNGVCAKETEADIAEHVFSKGQLELKTLNQHLKPVIEILRKRTVVINIEYN